MLSPVSLASICNVRAPYSVGRNFRQGIFAVWYLGHPLTSRDNWGLNARGIAKYSDFGDFVGYNMSETVQDRSKVSINHK